MENQPVLYVTKNVSDEHIYLGFEGIFGIFGNNVVEQIEVRGNHKIVHVSNAIYSASIISEDDIYEEIGPRGITIGLFRNRWVYSDGVIGEHDYNVRCCRT
jgi:hypothetical protein